MQTIFWLLVMSCDVSRGACEDRQPLADLTYHIPEGAESIGEDVRLVIRGNQAILHWRDENGEHQMVYDVVGLE